MEELVRSWDGESVLIHLDRSTGAWMVIAVHSTYLGPATGGTRLRSYPSLTSAVADALALAEGMTMKFAAVDFPRGGGKGVIAVPPNFDSAQRHGLLRRYGDLVASLGGRFCTGPDVGTSSTDMDIIAQNCGPYVHSRSVGAGGAGDSSPATALGVYQGMLITCERLFGSRTLQGRRILVQGAGSVGSALTVLLRRAGADVLVSDIDAAALMRVGGDGVTVIPTDHLYDTACDIYAPCALGAVLNATSIGRLRCRGVVGAANNQLATPEDAARLEDRGILYAPDFVVNVGGAMAITGIESLGWTVEEAAARVRRAVDATLGRVYSLAETEGITTVAAAQRIARKRLTT